MAARAEINLLEPKLLGNDGHPNQALSYAEDAVTYAEQTDQPNRLADALALTASLHTQTGADVKAGELAHRALLL